MATNGFALSAKALLHRYFWQRLPRTWRREMLFRATTLLAPRAPRGVRPKVPIFVAGTLRTISGLGVSARLCHDALRDSDVPVYGVDLTAGLMQANDLAAFSFEDGRGFIGPGVVLLHVNSPLVPLALWQLGRQFVRDKYVIGYWAWELPEVPAEWRHGLSLVHEIWVPSQFTAEAVLPISGGRPIRIVPHPVALRARPAGPMARSSGRPFTVLVIFDMASSFARKNPVAAIAAFRKAFGVDPSCRLIVKTSNGHVFAKGIDAIMNAIGSSQNVMLIDKVMTDAELDTLYDASDVLISLHRSEGFGLTIAEAMLRGLPVVATNWSGNVDFLNFGNGLPISYTLVPAEDPQATYHRPSISWADADVEAASLALCRLRAEPELARQLGEAGAAFALRTWGRQWYVEMVLRNLHL